MPGLLCLVRPGDYALGFPRSRTERNVKPPVDTQLFGRHRRLLETARESVIAHLRDQLHRTADSFHLALRGRSGDRFICSKLEYHVLSLMLKQTFREALNTYLAASLSEVGIPYPIIRSKENRFGNAAGAFDAEDLMFSVLDISLYYKFDENRNYSINLKKVSLRLSVNDMKNHLRPRFPGDKAYACQRLSGTDTQSQLSALRRVLEQVPPVLTAHPKQAA